MPQYRLLVLFLVSSLCCASAAAQQQTPPSIPTTPIPPLQQPQPPATNAVAATVNGTSIPELAVYRALIGVPPTKQGEYRTEILNYLIDNALLDQYLDQMKIDVEAKDVDSHIEKVKAELLAKGKKLEDVYSGLMLTEAEMRLQIRATLRWDRFIQQYGTDKTLKDFFEANKAIFDGSSMHAKHILLKTVPGDPQAEAVAKAKIAALRKQVEAQVNQALSTAAKLDNLEKQRLKIKVLDENFSALAAKESACSSKDAGGDLGWFPRVGGGRVSESFAKAAFGLKSWEMSDAVTTEYGIHLILCVDYKEGVVPNFEQIRELVRDVYADKMREAVVARMRPSAKIVVNGAAK